MHRYREYGVASEEDEALRRAFRDGFKRAGGSFPRFLEALAWHRDEARPGATEAQLMEAFSAYAANRGWSNEERDRAIDTYRAVRGKGPSAAALAAPTAEEDRATVARGDDVLRRDPARYWNDIELQDSLFEARERLDALAQSGAAVTQAPALDAPRKRIEEIEALLSDPSGAGQRSYWNDAALRQDYADALARVHEEAISGRAPAADSAQAPDVAPSGAASPA